MIAVDWSCLYHVLSTFRQYLQMKRVGMRRFPLNNHRHLGTKATIDQSIFYQRLNAEYHNVFLKVATVEPKEKKTEFASVNGRKRIPANLFLIYGSFGKIASREFCKVIIFWRINPAYACFCHWKFCLVLMLHMSNHVRYCSERHFFLTWNGIIWHTQENNWKRTFYCNAISIKKSWTLYAAKQLSKIHALFKEI